MPRAKHTLRAVPAEERYKPNPTLCGTRANMLWPEKSVMAAELKHYYGVMKPYNRRRALAAMKAGTIRPVKHRQDYCDAIYYLSKAPGPGSSATRLSVARIAPRKVYAKKHVPYKKLKCKAGSQQCGRRCISDAKACWVEWDSGQQRYLTKREMQLM
jgi:hypothetical protein